MIDVNIRIDFSSFDEDVKKFHKQKITVGVLDKAKGAAIPKSKSAGLKNFAGGKARKIKSRSRSLKLTELAIMMDEIYGVFTDAPRNFKSRDLNIVMGELTALFDEDGLNEKRLLNGARALVRNQIIRRDFGSNAASTIDVKGFDRPMIDTGAFFNSIEAKYEVER